MKCHPRWMSPPPPTLLDCVVSSHEFFSLVLPQFLGDSASTNPSRRWYLRQRRSRIDRDNTYCLSFDKLSIYPVPLWDEIWHTVENSMRKQNMYTLATRSKFTLPPHSRDRVQFLSVFLSRVSVIKWSLDWVSFRPKIESLTIEARQLTVSIRRVSINWYLLSPLYPEMRWNTRSRLWRTRACPIWPIVKIYPAAVTVELCLSIFLSRVSTRKQSPRLILRLPEDRGLENQSQAADRCFDVLSIYPVMQLRWDVT